MTTTHPPKVHTPLYGRLADDFVAGDVYAHPVEVTLDAGRCATFCSAFLDFWPLAGSDRLAKALHFAGRPVPPHLLMNLALSTSVHDVSEQAIAHLAYVRVDFPKVLPVGGTVRGATRVMGVRYTQDNSRAVVHVQTVLTDEHGDRVLDMERKALVPAGTLTTRPQTPSWQVDSKEGAAWLGRLPVAPLGQALALRQWPSAAFEPPLRGRLGDFAPGDVVVHSRGRTVGESESMQLCMVLGNTHPLHFDAEYAKIHSFTGQRVVYGGLVASWVLTLASADVAGHALWELQWRDGAHPAPVAIGDTLRALTLVEACTPVNEHYGVLRLRHVGIKNADPVALLGSHPELFVPELTKTRETRVPGKVFEITRELLVRR